MDKRIFSDHLAVPSDSAVIDGLPERTVGGKGPPIYVAERAKGNDTILGSLRRRQHNFGRNISTHMLS
jgi:hypothetical protein